MADLRDRYRRDYRSVPIPTPPRSSNPRGNFIGAPPVPKASTPPNTTSTTSASPTPATVQHAPTRPVAQPKPVPIPSPPPPATAVPKAIPNHVTPAAPQATSKPQEAPTSPIQSQAHETPKKASKRLKKAHRAQKRKRSGRIKKFVVIPVFCLVILAGLVVGGSYAWYAYQMKRPLPIDDSYVSSANYPIYLPDKLPQGYAIDKSTFNTQDNALVFTIRNSSDEYKAVQVSEQKLPDHFNPNKQLPDNPAGPGSDDRKFSTPVGKVEVATWQNRLVASLGTPKTWIIMNISTVPASDADAIAKSFQQLRPTSPWEPLQDFRSAVTDKVKSVI